MEKSKTKLAFFEPLYKYGIELINKHIILHACAAPVPTEEAKTDIREGIAALDQALLYVPFWPALWIKGKGHQRLEEHQEAAQAFEQSWQIARRQPPEKNHANILRELVLELLYLKQFPKALAAASMAKQIDPNDSGLQANYAVALLFVGKTEESLKECQEALRRDEKDEVTKELLSYIKEIVNGTKPVPKCVEDVP